MIDFGEDPQYRLKAYWLHLEASTFQNIAEGRLLFDSIVKKHREEALVWLDFINFEK